METVGEPMQKHNFFAETLDEKRLGKAKELQPSPGIDNPWETSGNTTVQLGRQKLANIMILQKVFGTNGNTMFAKGLAKLTKLLDLAITVRFT